MGDAVTAALGAGVMGFVFSLIFAAAVFALFCWLLYAIIWRAVRRGLREYNGEMRDFSTSDYLGLGRRP